MNALETMAGATVRICPKNSRYSTFQAYTNLGCKLNFPSSQARDVFWLDAGAIKIAHRFETGVVKVLDIILVTFFFSSTPSVSTHFVDMLVAIDPIVFLAHIDWNTEVSLVCRGDWT